MSSVFTLIINGEIPGRFVWKDDRCAAFLTVNPLTPGHTLIVPRAEVDEWTQVDADLWAHLSGVAQTVGQAIQEAFGTARVGMVIAGYEVPHCHLHVFGADRMDQFDFANVEVDPDPAALDDAAMRIRRALRDRGHAGVSE